MFGTRRNTFTEPLPPVPLPFAMWKQPFSRGHFLGFHPDAWHSWQIGCGSEGDGLWKQCPCLQPTHCRHIHKGRLTRRYMTAARVRTQSHTRRSWPPCPTLETKREVACCKQGGDLDVKHTKKTGNLNKSWLPSTWTLSPLLFSAHMSFISVWQQLLGKLNPEVEFLLVWSLLEMYICAPAFPLTHCVLWIVLFWFWLYIKPPTFFYYPPC